jgi:hypothetical protein
MFVGPDAPSANKDTSYAFLMYYAGKVSLSLSLSLSHTHTQTAVSSMLKVKTGCWIKLA